MKFFAYLDPGTGSLIIQAVIGAAAGIGIFFRDSIGRLFSKGRQSLKDKNKDKK